ncbi:MAG: hypothetical protein PT118_01520 [Aphanizomenon gracile PMC644.10]|jgi:hypothetical protein|nr:hypothetical protein [Aphanizomenon gracile PMC644.10]
MLEPIQKLMNSLPPLHAKKEPTVALIVGILFGGIGLGIYFRSFVDFVLLFGIAIAITFAFGDPGIVAGVILAGLYGYFRAVESNKRV